MASDEKKKNINKEKNETNQDNKSLKNKKNKARQFRAPKDYVPASGTFSYVLPSYHVSTKPEAEPSQDDRHHTVFHHHDDESHYVATPIEGRQEVHPQPVPVVGGTDKPKGYFRTPSNHHFHHANYVKPVTPLTGTTDHNHGTSTFIPKPIITPTTNTTGGSSHVAYPIGGTPQTGTVVEDTVGSANGQVDIHNREPGIDLVFTADKVQGQYGVFTLDKDTGEWTYTLDNVHHQDLAQGEAHTEVMQVTATNIFGLTKTLDVTVTVKGTNDIPVITSQAQTDATKEDDVLFVNGQVIASDVDHGAVLTYTPDNTQGQYGQFSVDPATGKWTYTLDNSGNQALAEGEHHTETMLVTVTDEHGAKTTQTVTVDVEGTNDKPVITSQPQTGTVKEDDVLAAKGQVIATDVDHGSSLTFTPDNLQGQYGSFVLDSKSGAWTYTLDNTKHQDLALGEHHLETFLVTVTDEKGGSTTQKVFIEVEGTNDNPIVSHIVSRTVDEGAPVISGTITSTDVDHGDTVKYSTTFKHAGFSLDEDGTYHLDPTDPVFDHLAVGEHETLIVPVIATDNNGGQSKPQNLIIRVDGTNDNPVVSHIASRTVNEGDKAITGTITSTDIDHGDTATYSTTFKHAGFTLNQDGTYTLDPTDPVFDHLAVGDHETLIVPVIATDNNGGQSQPQNLIIRVDGTNDDPVVSHIASRTVDEGAAAITGQVTSTDIDDGDTAKYSTTFKHAGFSLDEDGTYHLDPTDPVFDHLAVGEHETLIVPVIATDNNSGQSKPQNLIIRVDGTNDNPVVSHIASRTVNEGDKAITGTITSTDIDHGDTATYSTTFKHAGFTLNQDGTYTLDPTDPVFDHLAVGDHETLIVPVIATDNNGGQSQPQNLIIRVDGTNDDPVVSHITSRTVDEGAAVITGQVTSTDIDDGDTAKYSTTFKHAGFSLDEDGTYHLDPTDPVFDHLAVGEHETLIVPVIATDNNGGQSKPQNLIIRVDGTNDNPVVSHIASRTVNEGDKAISGTITSTDIDHGDTATYSTTFKHAGFTLNQDGTYTLDPTNPVFDHLAVGDHETLIVPVIATDNNGGQSQPQNLIIRVDGTNDDPVVSHIASRMVDEGAAAITGQVTSTDIDDGDTAKYSTTFKHAGFSLDEDGTYHLDPTDPVFDHLAVGDHETLIVPVIATDNNGGQSKPQNLIIRVDGTNDNPVVSHISSRTVNEGDKAITGTITSTDIDHGDTATYSTTFKHAGFTLNQDGTYTLDPTNPVFDHLAVGDHETLIVPVIATDNNGGQSQPQNLIIRVDGTNDKPVISGDVSGQIVETGDNYQRGHNHNFDHSISEVHGQLNAMDPDDGDTTTWGIKGIPHAPHFSVQGKYGTFTMDANGAWSYQIDENKADALNISQNPRETFTVTATDKSGVVVSQDIVVNVHGANDNPVLTAFVRQDTSEDSGLFKIALSQGQASDVDHNDKLTFSTSNTDNWVSLDTNSGETTVDTSAQHFQHLAEGESETLSIPVTVHDNHGGMATQTLQVIVHGTNDKPVINSVEVIGVTDASGTPLAHPRGGLIKDHTNFNDRMHLNEDNIVSGALKFTDVDTSDTHTVTATAVYTDAGGHKHQLSGSDLQRAGFEIKNDGSFILDASSPLYQSLQIGEVGRLDVTTSVNDHHIGGEVQQHLHFVIHGQEDKPVVRQMPALVTNEDTHLHFTSTDLLGDHNQNVRDPDGDPLALFNVHVEDGHGHIIDHGNGKYEFIPDANYHGTVHIGYTVTDGRVDAQGQDITTQVTGWPVNVIPVNDAPKQIHNLVATVNEDSSDLIITEDQLRGLLTDIDDTTAKLVVSNLQLTDKNAGSLTDNHDGTWTYTPAQDFNTRHAGSNGHEKLVGLTFDYTDVGTSAFGQSGPQSGSYSGTANIKVDPVGDAAVITAPQGGIGVTAAQGQEVATVQLGITDPDWHQQQFRVTSTIRGTYGVATIDRQGHLEYHLNLKDPDVLALGGGQHLTETVTATAKDGTTKDITIDITGTNQAPEITVAAPIRATESNIGDPVTQVTGNFKAIDPDLGDTLQFSCTNPPDGLIVNADGSYAFNTAASAYNSLKEGEVKTITFDLSVSDGHVTTTKPVSLIITGTNDAPVISTPLPIAQIQTGEDHYKFGQDLLLNTAVDPDGDVLHVLKVGTQHTDVTVLDKSLGHIEEDGQGGYTFYPSAQAINHPGGKDVTISYTVTDGRETATGHMVVHVDQHAHVDTNHPNPHHHTQTTSTANPPQAPKDDITGKLTGDVTEDGDSWNTGSGTSDSRQGEVTAHSPGENPHGVTGSNHIEGSHGYGYATVVPGTDSSHPGHWTYHLYNHNGDTDPVNQLAEGKTLTETFTLTSPHGGSEVVTVTIHGTNDKPVITGESNVQVSAVSGSNAHILPAWQTNHIVEVDTMQVTGEVHAKDVDGDTLTFGITPSTGAHPALQGFTVTADGHYTYVPSNSDPLLNGLAPGQTKDVTAWIRVKDGHGGVVDTPVHFTVHGRNTAPTADARVDLGHSDEDTNIALHSTPVSGSGSSQGLDLVGLAHAKDADGDTLYVTNIKQTGVSHGTFKDLGHGNYQFIPSKDFHGDVKFTYEITDGLASKTVTAILHVDSVNDQPTVTKLGLHTDEDNAITFTVKDIIGGGVAHNHGIVDDPDFATDPNSEHLKLTGVTLKDPTQGTLHDDGNGHFTFTPALNFEGKVELQYTVTDSLVDAHNAPHLSATGVIEVVVNPVNDIPTFKVISQEHVKEDANGLNAEQIAHGQVQISDVDKGEAHFIASSHIPGRYGYLEIDKDGNWEYHLMKNYAQGVQALNEGEVFNEHFNLPTGDGRPDRTTYPLDVQIIGTNDGASISGPHTGTATTSVTSGVTQTLTSSSTAVATPDPLVVTGQMKVTDVDQGQDGFKAETLQPSGSGHHYGSLTITKDGHWTYTVDNNRRDVQELHEGEQIQEHFTVTSIDGTATKEITVTLVGKNNAPVIESVQEVDANEGSAPISGQLVATDIDNDAGTITFEVQQGEVLPAGFVLNSDGSYSFDPADGHYDYLADGDKLDVVAHVVAKDSNTGVSQPRDIVIHLTGTNDAATITGTSTATVIDSPTISKSTTTQSQTLSVSDPDHDENYFQPETNLAPESSSAGYGHLSITADGEWQYHVDDPDSIKAIPSGHTLTETFIVHTTDGTAQTITVSLHGENEAAIISGDITGSVQEDVHVQGNTPQTVFTTGVLNVVDPDTGEAHFVRNLNVHAVNDQYGGSLSIEESGAWTYSVPNSNIQKLAAGETVDVVYQVTTAGGDTQDITVTITGANDAPTVSGAVTLTQHGTEDSELIISKADLLANAHDVDTSDSFHIENPIVDPSAGTVAVDSNGNLIFRPVLNFNGDVTLTYDVVDSHAGKVQTTATFTVDAVNDSAKIGGDDFGWVDEDGRSMFTGLLMVTDSDNGENYFQSGDVVGTYGRLHIQGDGHWTYYLDNNKAQHLSEGEKVTETLQIQSADGTTHEIHVDVNGANDAPTISNPLSKRLKKDSDLTFKPNFFGFHDDDSKDRLASVVVTSIPKHGQLLLNGHAVASGQKIQAADIKQLVFHPDANFNGDTQFGYRVSDGHAHSATRTATLHVTAVNDTAVVTQTPAHLSEHAPLSQTGVTTAGMLSITDPDAGDDKFIPQTGLAGKYGTLNIDEHGSWSYTYTQGHSAITGLKANQHVDEVIQVETQDGTKFDLHIQINGENDKPVITVSSPVAENGLNQHQFALSEFGFQDADNDDLDHITVTSLPDGAAGKLLLNGHAVALNQDIDKADIAHLVFENSPTAHDGQVAMFGFTVNDGHVDSDPATMALTLHQTQTQAMASVHPAPPPPPPPPVAADEPLQDVPVETLILESLGSSPSTHSGAQAYLGQLGIEPSQHLQTGDQAMPSDLDIVLSSDSAPVLDEHGLPVDDASLADLSFDEHKHHEDDDPAKYFHDPMDHSDWSDHHR